MSLTVWDRPEAERAAAGQPEPTGSSPRDRHRRRVVRAVVVLVLLSIVAVVRGGAIIASPRPDFVFHPGDLVVVVGTAEGAAATTELFARG